MSEELWEVQASSYGRNNHGDIRYSTENSQWYCNSVGQ